LELNVKLFNVIAVILDLKQVAPARSHIKLDEFRKSII